jgi:hypothetical protein
MFSAVLIDKDLIVAPSHKPTTSAEERQSFLRTSPLDRILWPMEAAALRAFELGWRRDFNLGIVSIERCRDPEHRMQSVADYGLLVLEPVDCCGEAEHAHEG